MSSPFESDDQPSPLEALLPDLAPPRPIGPGSTIDGRFELQSELGSGSTGRIYLARDRVLDEKIALKILRPEIASQGNSFIRFMAEIRLARQVSHPNVCRIYDYGEDRDVRYITMEYIEGEDLSVLLEVRGRGLESREGYEVALGVAAGVAAIHRAGILHRDLKTSNVMIDGEGVVRVMDFGLAKGSGKRGAAALTAKGALLGTPEYMSPEQATGEELDQRTDIYSLGIVCFEIFTGKVPFQGQTLVKTLMAQMRSAPPLEGPEAEGLPAPMVPVLRRALEKRPQDRFQTVTEMTQALEEARQASDGAAASVEVRRAQAPAVVSGAMAADTSADGAERRRQRRLDFPVDCKIRMVGPDGQMREERTVAENISIGGVRVRTSFGSLRAGDRVTFDEMDGSFKAASEVRCCRLGRDNVHRLHLQFVASQAPKHLVGTG